MAIAILAATVIGGRQLDNVVRHSWRYQLSETLIHQALQAEGRQLLYDPWRDLQPLTQPSAIKLAQQALEESSHLVAADPFSIQAQQQLGRIALLLDQTDTAIAAFSAATARQPDSPLRWLELGLAYARLGESIVPLTTDTSFWQITNPSSQTSQNWSLRAPLPRPDWWDSALPITRTVVVGNHITIRALLPTEPMVLVFWMGNQTAQPDTYQVLLDNQLLAEYQLTREAAVQGWQPATLDLHQWAGQKIELNLISDYSLSGWGDLQIVPATAVRCVMVDCRQRAYEAWQHGNFTGDQFLHNGVIAFRQQQFADALHWYERAAILGIDITSAKWYLYYRATGDRDALRQSITFDQGWSNEEYQLRAWFEWGLLHFNRQNFTEAARAFRRAIAVETTDPTLQYRRSETYRYLGLVLWQQDRLTEALGYLAQAVTIDRRNPWAQIHYGKVLYLTDPTQVDQTEQAFTTALTLDSRPEIWQNLIDFWYWQKDLDRAHLLCSQAYQYGIEKLEGCE
ncbi:tetratricopeptide repeat protein [Chloroflexus sp.]|uniref:tetratricopeptide repeat protein n=1 Tax=Chloroflexus sp. TaxID=1904827 RepID=UPI002ACE79E0|nr:tetratricopeptide repeat protein [Chloroflexus sp.]